VQITIGNEVTITDHNGVFVLNNASVNEKFAYIKASKTGYINGSRTIIPTLNETNDIQITLLERDVIGSVSSGVSSEVTLPNGSKVEFQGEFIDINGNSYNGQVEVSMHYLEPNQEVTFNQMPGMLFGKRESGVASAMETYGMLAVNLYSPSGEQLNIAETSPATLTFPIVTSTSNAPETIALWYFDEAVGYWKEQGMATKVSNEYTAEVTHFSWWNCDLPLDYINACFTVESSTGGDISNKGVEIILNSTNQLIFSGLTNANGAECGAFPKNEEVTVNILSECSNTIIYSEVVGPFSLDSSFTITLPSLPSELSESLLMGTVNNCNGSSVTNGYALLFKENDISNVEYISITNGIINHSFIYCNTSVYKIIVFDLDVGQSSTPMVLNLNSSTVNMGTITACEQTGGTYGGSITLLTQSEVNNFGLFGYDKIQGDLTLGGYNLQPPTDISSLQSLVSLIEITGNLRIEQNPLLENLNGFENINSIVGSLNIHNNVSLNSISGLSNLTSVTGELKVSSNNSLTYLTGLNNIATIGGNLKIKSNSQLSSLSALSSLLFIGNGLEISGNNLLTNLNGLNNIASIPGPNRLFISGNDSLVSLTGLNNVTSIGGDLFISTCPFTSLSGLSSLTTLGGKMKIQGSSLTSLNGLENLISTQDIIIGVNYSPNYNLSNFCALTNLFTNGSYGTVTIEYNAYNPTVSGIQAGNCSN